MNIWKLSFNGHQQRWDSVIEAVVIAESPIYAHAVLCQKHGSNVYSIHDYDFSHIGSTNDPKSTPEVVCCDINYG